MQQKKWARSLLVFFWILSLVTSSDAYPGAKKPPKVRFVDVQLEGQLGNQLFQIAAAYAYALDHNLPLVIPELAHKTAWNVKGNASRLFLHKIAHHALPKPARTWSEPSFQYTPLPHADQIKLYGFFQSEKYFQHRRAEIMELFAPPHALREEIITDYPFLTSEALVVGVQIRDYRVESPYVDGSHHPTFGRAYYTEAVRHFPKEAIFIVTSNNLPFAKECMEGLSENIIYLECVDYIKDFYTLCLCKSFIISNSSFGWWVAWLSQSDNKKLVVPYLWFGPPYPDQMWRDLVPRDAIVLNVEPLVRRY